MLIALDSNVFIAALSNSEQHSKLAQKLVKDMNSGVHTGVASSLIYGEVLSVVVDSELHFEEFLSVIENFSTVDASDSVCLQAGQLRKQHGPKLRLPDAIHLATALNTGADVFVTNDKTLAKVAGEFIPTKRLSQKL